MHVLEITLMHSSHLLCSYLSRLMVGKSTRTQLEFKALINNFRWAPTIWMLAKLSVVPGCRPSSHKSSGREVIFEAFVLWRTFIRLYLSICSGVSCFHIHTRSLFAIIPFSCYWERIINECYPLHIYEKQRKKVHGYAPSMKCYAVANNR